MTISRTMTLVPRRIITPRTLRSVVARALSSEAEAPASVLKLNFSLPHETVYHQTPVHSVILPGIEGDYGVAATHVPYVAQLKPGLVQIIHDETNTEPEKYFVAGGYAMTHPNSTTVRGVPTVLLVLLLFNYTTLLDSNKTVSHTHLHTYIHTSTYIYIYISWTGCYLSRSRQSRGSGRGLRSSQF